MENNNNESDNEISNEEIEENNQENIGYDSHYAPPNDDEIRQLRNTNEIVQSQLLKMEVLFFINI